MLHKVQPLTTKHGTARTQVEKPLPKELSCGLLGKGVGAAGEKVCIQAFQRAEGARRGEKGGEGIITDLTPILPPPQGLY